MIRRDLAITLVLIGFCLIASVHQPIERMLG